MKKLNVLIRNFASRWYDTHSVIRSMETEAETGLFVMDVIKPVAALTAYPLRVSCQMDEDVTKDDIEEASYKVVSSSREVSLSDRGDIKLSSISTDVPEESEEAPANQGIIDLKADLTDPVSLSRIYFALEFQLKQQIQEKEGGRCEFFLTDGHKNPRLIIEVKSRSSNLKKAVFQLAAHLILTLENTQPRRTTPLWGCCTDYFSWIFVCLEGNHIRIGDRLAFGVENGSHIHLVPSALSVYAFLFHSLGIPPDVPVEAVTQSTSQTVIDFCKRLFALFPDA